jgi:hypothetical protein
MGIAAEELCSQPHSALPAHRWGRTERTLQARSAKPTIPRMKISETILQYIWEAEVDHQGHQHSSSPSSNP